MEGFCPFNPNPYEVFCFPPIFISEIIPACTIHGIAAEMKPISHTAFCAGMRIACSYMHDRVF